MQGLYPYQERVRKVVNDGNNVIIQAPTGAGKTLAALFPFFENLDQFADVSYPAEAPLPQTCRYAVPMRVLATQFEREYHNYFSRLDRKRGTRFQQLYGKLGISLPSILTGETPQDPKFESPLTFCTIDQLLASFVGTPYSLGPGQANLNVAAAIGSYLILDEFHLYPLDSSGGARMTSLAMLRLLKGFCRFTVMTATFSTKLLSELATLLDAEVVRVEDEQELACIMHGRQRTIRRSDDCMTAEAIWTAHQAARERRAGASLVVCNTVGRAQQVYMQLRDLLERDRYLGDIRLQLLHSRYTPAHRRQKSEWLEAWLGKDAWHEGVYDGPDTIVVATQVVEVGLNISAGVLHTEVAPASSVIQRAGRCARFEQQSGDVIVYPIPPRDSGGVSHRPYDRSVCEATWDALPTSSTPFGFTQEQDLIDVVHTAEDTAFLGRFYQSETQVKEFIKDTLTTHAPEHQSKLIRNVGSVSVLIHAAPEDAITTKPFDWETFTLHSGSLEGAWDKLHQRAQSLDLPWVMKELIFAGSLREDPDSDREQPYIWQVILSKEKIPRALQVALPPELAAYDEHLGFRLLLGDHDASSNWNSGPMEKKRFRREFAKREQRSYVEHISGLMAAYDWSVRRELAWISSRLEAALEVHVGSLDLAARLAIACHDIGKLGNDWQHWAHATQETLAQNYGALYRVQPGREFLAKTDALDSARWEEEKAIQESLRQQHIVRPPHACAGVLAGGQLIARQFLASAQPEQQNAVSTLTRATLTAIAHHHAPTAASYDAISWREGSVREVLATAFSTCRLDVSSDNLDLTPRLSDGQLPATYLVSPAFGNDAERFATWIAFMLVRALRLCDQRAERDWGIPVRWLAGSQRDRKEKP